MRVAALYDIHGNLPALEAVLDEMHRADVDQVVVGGDVVPGPMPRETLECLIDLDLPTDFIRGNGETEIFAQVAGRETGNVPVSYREVMRWVAGQLSQDQLDFMAGWPATRTLDMDGLGGVLFCHATPRNDTEIFTARTAADRVRSAFASVSGSLVICGHTHIQFDRTIDDLRIVNAGSVGMPFDAPGAYWVLLETNVELRCTTFDLAGAAERIRNTNYPQAAEFAKGNVLDPPNAQQMLDVFGKTELTS